MKALHRVKNPTQYLTYEESNIWLFGGSGAGDDLPNGNHSLALKSDGSVTGWDFNATKDNLTGAPSNLLRVHCFACGKVLNEFHQLAFV